MDRIEISPNDKQDLLELLEYAKLKHNQEKSTDKRDHWNDAGWWNIRIEQLKMIIKGYVPHTSYIQSSYTTIDKELTQSEKAKIRYRDSLSNDIMDLMDYFDTKKDSKDLF